MSLFERNSKNLLFLKFCRNIVRINLNDAVISVLFCLKDFKSLFAVRRRDNSVRNFFFNKERRRFVTFSAKRNKIAERRHTVCTAGTRIRTRHRRKLYAVRKINLFEGIRKRLTDCSAGWRNVLERCCGRKSRRFCKLLYKLVAVKSIKKIDKARFSVQNGNRQIRTIFHKDPSRFLIRVASVF